ncbi:MAG: hypothetical protein JSV34_03710 [Candidatus Omnitrophota bacterium]|nr:MAG: hypothetical protein JSV34_03710 [Candidatus Omnitrophota bacterium]
MPVIKGTKGDWEYNITPGKTYQNEKSGDRIEIKYKPKPGTCSDIRLVQTVKWVAYDSNNNVVTTNPKDMYPPNVPNKFRFRANSEVAVNGEIYSIDYRKCESEPYFNGDSVKGKASRGDATKTPPENTEMKDRPHTGIESMKQNIVKVVKHFKTCAICVETGAILGCMSWTSTATRNPYDHGTINVNPTECKKVSPASVAALKQFINTHVTTDSNGKRYWKCEETGKKGKNATTGRTLPPINDDFYDKWGTVKKSSFQWIELDQQHVGGGKLSDDLVAVVTKSINHPAQSAIKFTWAGEQDKTISGVVLTPMNDISAEDISPFVYDEVCFQNDFVSLVAVSVTPELLISLLESVSEFGEQLTEPKGPVIVSIITNPRTNEAFGFYGSLNSKDLDVILKSILFPNNESEKAIEMIGYLSFNMGLP